MIGVNAAGINCKSDSFNDILKRLKPQVICIQETKLKPESKIKCDEIKNYQSYYLHREKSEGGGIAICVDNEIESTEIRRGDDEVEALVICVEMGSLTVRVVTAYGPQEYAPVSQKNKFWDFLDEEACLAEMEGQGLIIQMDGNLHAGPDLVHNDPNQQNRNGKLFEQYLARNPSIHIGNNFDICKGNITRKRLLENRIESSVLDFYLVNEKMKPFLTEIIIDEERNYCLRNYSQYKKNNRVIETDHNLMIAEFDIDVPKRKPERIEILNLKNRECQNKFYSETNENQRLVACFEDDNVPFEKQCKMWLRVFKNILFSCFRKVRVVSRKPNTSRIGKSFDELNSLKQKLKSSTDEQRIDIECQINNIEEDIADSISDEFKNELESNLKSIGGDTQSISGSGRIKLWQVLKKHYPKNIQSPPVGKKDESGNMITNHEALKKLYFQTYQQRLRNRPIKEELEEFKSLKEELFELRLKIAQSSKSKPWTMDDLNRILDKLKPGKARDPNGWCTEIFKEGVAGHQLKLSLLIMFNKIKSEKYIPDFIRKADVATIYKGKGERTDLKNERGISS